MYRISTPAALTAIAVSVALGIGATAVAAEPPVPVNPTQQQALDATETLRRFVLAHPDAPVPTTPPATSTAPPTTVAPTPPSTTNPPQPPTASPTPPPATTSPARTTLSGLAWSDGVWSMHSATGADQFATWRGKGVDNVSVFTSRENWAAMQSNWWSIKAPAANAVIPASFSASRDDFVIALPLWTDDGAAGTDAQWTTLANQIKAVDPNGYVRLGWEMNCCFSKATNAATWRAQYSRAATLLKAAAPGLRMVFNPVEGSSGSGIVADMRTLVVLGKVDVIGIDAYDFYPAYNTDANWANHRDKTYGWNFWYDYAQANGMGFAVPEFGVYTALTVSGGDNPKYINYVYTWLAQKAAAKPGSITFVSYFNESAAYCKCNLYPTAPNPNAAAAYRTQINALAR